MYFSKKGRLLSNIFYCLCRFINNPPTPARWGIKNFRKVFAEGGERGVRNFYFVGGGGGGGGLYFFFWGGGGGGG